MIKKRTSAEFFPNKCMYICPPKVLDLFGGDLSVCRFLFFSFLFFSFNAQ